MIREKPHGPDHPDVAQGLENYADLLPKTGRGVEAEPLEARGGVSHAKRAFARRPLRCVQALVRTTASRVMRRVHPHDGPRLPWKPMSSHQIDSIGPDNTLAKARELLQL